jgi:ATP adenylyltransferase
VSLDHLWAGWRTGYIDQVSNDDTPLRSDGDGRSLFERILASDEPDEKTYIVWRGDACFALLNAYPYGSGHLMVLPKRAVADLEALTTGEASELWQAVTSAVRAIKAAYRPDGVNVGLNLGHGAGAGVPDHLHVHCLPRWFGDTNFVTTIAETRVLPEPLTVTWERLRAAWPT